MRRTFILLILLGEFHISSSYKEGFYHLLKGLSGTATPIWTINGITHIRCSYVCMETHLCSSLEYNTLTFDCKMYNEFGINPSTNDHTSLFGERCPKSLGYTYEKSMDFCYLVHGQWLTWFTAQGVCAGERGQLVKVDTMEKLIYLNSSVTDNTKNYWTGANDQIIEGTFEWRDGTVLANDNEVWGLNQPDDWGGEDCCEIKPALGWKIQDDNCGSTLWFICEYVVLY